MAKAQEFFAKLFDWRMTPSGGPATVVDTGGAVTGHITALGHEPHTFTHFCVEVDDIKSCLDKATGLGGKTLVPPVEIPTGTFAWFADPEGNIVGLWKPKT
jgi:predicted enzyme related to lactoylglutathione lyase